MSRCLSFWLILAPILAAGAPDVMALDYASTPLERLILESDAIVLGRVVSQEEKGVEIAVQRRIAGSVAPRLPVAKFRFGPRAPLAWPDYRPSDRYLWFLEDYERTGDRTPRHIWMVLGPQGQGETPIRRDGQTAFAYVAMERFANDSPAELNWHGRTVRRQRIELEQLIDAVTFVRRCARLVRLAGGGPRRIAVTCPAQRINEAARRSALHAHLAQRLSAVP